MKTVLASLFLCVATAFGGTRGIINDPDGFTNLRDKPGENGAVVAKVKAGEIFEYEGAADQAWWKIKLTSGKTGWMHNSRIRVFAALAEIVDGGDMDEVNIAARQKGLTYYPLARAAAKGDPAAMRTYFKFESDGAGQGTHLDVLLKVVHLLGDDKLAQAVGEQSAAERAAFRTTLRDAISAALPFEPKAYWNRNFPKTAKILYSR